MFLFHVQVKVHQIYRRSWPLFSEIKKRSRTRLPTSWFLKKIFCHYYLPNFIAWLPSRDILGNILLQYCNTVQSVTSLVLKLTFASNFLNTSHIHNAFVFFALSEFKYRNKDSFFKLLLLLPGDISLNPRPSQIIIIIMSGTFLKPEVFILSTLT